MRRTGRTGRVSATALCLLLGSACGDGGQGPRDAAPKDDLGAAIQPELDVLFVIDNTRGMTVWVEALARYVHLTLDPILQVQPTPDLHLGIITPDLGVGRFEFLTCHPGGDSGALQNQNRCQPGPSGYAGLVNPEDRFLTYGSGPDGTLVANFTGDVAEALLCYAPVEDGCGFEHQLASTWAALEGCNGPGGCGQPLNNGFLRPEARLAIIVLTDRDDCSAPPDTDLFDPAQTSLESELGPMRTYRCFQFGVLCGGADPGRDPGPREDCVPGSFDPNPKHELIPVEDMVDSLKSLKPGDPRKIYVAVVAGPPGPVSVYIDENGVPALDVVDGISEPGIRLARFLALFDEDRARFLPMGEVVSTTPRFREFLGQVGDDVSAMLTH
jgi:hypothetical protein